MSVSFGRSLRLAGWACGCCFALLATSGPLFAQDGPPRTNAGAARPPRTAAAPANAGSANAAPAGRASASAPEGVQIALIDIAKVFKNHPGFNRQLEAVKADVAAFEKDMLAKRNQVTSQQSQLADFAVGSPEYKKTDLAITKQMSDMQVAAQLKKKDLLVEESRIYYNAYNEVLAEVQAVAQRYNISLVLRFESDAIDPLDRNSVLQGVNRPVVHQKGLDITDLVLDSLNAKYQATKVGAKPR